jgi:ribosomal protein S8
MMLQIVEETMSKYHSRVVRILKAKGFLEEKDIISMCLLSVKDTRTLINQLLSEGFV